MKNLNLTEESKTSSRVIHVDFRRNRPAIDFDPYLANVTEVHCRCCNHRRPRKGAQELMESWGYVCKCCMDKAKATIPQEAHKSLPISHLRF